MLLFGVYFVFSLAFFQSLGGWWQRERRQSSPPICDCIGSSSAKHHFVYLHGTDTFGPSWREIENREVLRVLADTLDLSIALPRSPFGRWPMQDASDFQWSLATIHRAAGTCFPRDARYGVVGFSDGGYLVNDVFARCIPSEALWLVSVGGEGSMQPGVRDLSRCGALRVIMGRHEPVFSSTQFFVTSAARRHADIRLIIHRDGHALPLAETRNVLAELFAKESQ